MSPLISYQPKEFSAASQSVIAHVVRILTEYAAQGFDLTLRQIYYQFITRDLFLDDRWWRWIEETRRWVRVEFGDMGATKNADPNYKWLGGIVNDGRLAGLIDWDHIVDRTRYLRSETYWQSPDEIIRAAASGFRLDKWATQPIYVEVWVEKDALIGVVEHACRPLETAFLSCRGYVSQSEMWRAAQRFGQRAAQGQNTVILHLGDHDPSGIDMSRDVEARIREFLWGDGHNPAHCFELRRIALNWDQIEEYAPPPNPAKITDSRARSYIARHGRDSWELDALEPAAIADLIGENVLAVRDEDAWAAVASEQESQGEVLRQAHERWREVAAFLNGGGADDGR